MSRHRQIDRRGFFQTTIRSATALTFSLPMIELLASCTVINEVYSTVSDGVVTAPIAAFGNGDIKEVLVLVHATGVKLPIALIRPRDGEVHALYAMCTHKQCPLDVDVTGFTCHCHGSTFDLQGMVTNGPARDPLQSLPVTTGKNEYIINVTALL